MHAAILLFRLCCLNDRKVSQCVFLTQSLSRDETKLFITFFVRECVSFCGFFRLLEPNSYRRTNKAVRQTMVCSTSPRCRNTILLWMFIAFPVTSFTPTNSRCSTRTTSLFALTERQLQFWEDVEEGLDDIESFWLKKGQDIDRIRKFSLR